MSGSLQRAIEEGRKGRPSDHQVDQAGARVLERLRAMGEDPGELPVRQRRPVRSRRWILVAACASAVLAFVVSYFVFPSRQTELARFVEGPLFRVSPVSGGALQPVLFGSNLSNGEVMRTGNDPGAEVVLLSDGSRIEIGAHAEFSFERVEDGIRVHLNSGSVIVTAARQAAGRHLYVETPHCTASVVGTVFVVRVEDGGSRVSVLEGQVQVRSAAKVELVHSGEQVTTNRAMAPALLQDEIAWSRKAGALRSLLTPVPAPTVVAAAAPLVSPSQFAVAPPATGPSSIEGIVVRRGTNEPIAGAELELSRVEGTSTAPLAPGVAEEFASILNWTTLGLPAQSSAPPALLAPEVKYGKTGSDGKFVFRDLKEGKYRLVAVRGGGAYFPVEFGQRDLMQRGLSFPITTGEAKKDVKLEMTPTGAISGRVVDEDGQPMGHVLVMALTATEGGGEAKPEIERVVLTDERGEYRIYWLGPGKYHVAAVYEDPQRRTMELAPQGPPARTITRERATSPVVIRQLLPDGSAIEEAYGVVYLGGAVDYRTARTVDVFAGETSGGADIPMGAGKKPVNHIRGVVINGDTGQPARGVSVLAIPRQRRPNALVLQGTSNADGTFDLAGAFSEGYLLTASGVAFNIATGQMVNATGQPAGPPQVGYVSVDVAGSDATNIRIVMRGGIGVAGRVTIEGKTLVDADPDLTKMSISLTRDPDVIAMPSPLMPLPPLPPQPAGSPPARRPGNGQVLASGEFNLFVSQGDFRMSVAGVPANMYVKSMRMGGDDVGRSGLHVRGPVDNPIQILIGTDGGTITGSAVDASLRAFTNATIALVPDAPDQRSRSQFYKNTTTDSEGNFKLTAISPGSYKLFAWEWAAPDAWQDADFIRIYENQGKTVQVTALGKVEKVQLSVIPRRK